VEPVAEWLNLQNRTVEPVFGQSIQTQGTDRFLVRCKQVARGEWNFSPQAIDNVWHEAGFTTKA